MDNRELERAFSNVLDRIDALEQKLDKLEQLIQLFKVKLEQLIDEQDKQQSKSGTN